MVPGFNNNRINVQYLLISNYTERSVGRSAVFDIAILSEDLKYVEYEVKTVKRVLTKNVQVPFRQIFSDFQLTPNTKIYISESIDRYEPICMYVAGIAQQYMIRMVRYKTDKAVRRICHIHPSFLNRHDRDTKNGYDIRVTGKKYFLQRVWRKIIEKKLCPWITEAYDEYLRSKGYREYRYRKQLLRFGMYYIYSCSRKVQYDKNSKAKRSMIKTGTLSDITVKYQDNTVPEYGIFS